MTALTKEHAEWGGDDFGAFHHLRSLSYHTAPPDVCEGQLFLI